MYIPGSGNMMGFKPFRCKASKMLMKIECVPCDNDFQHTEDINLIVSNKTLNAVIFRVVIQCGDTYGKQCGSWRSVHGGNCV